MPPKKKKVVAKDETATAKSDGLKKESELEKEGEPKKDGELKIDGEIEAKSGTPIAVEDEQNKEKNDNKKNTSSRVVPLVGKKIAEDRVDSNEPEDKKGSIGDEKGRNDDMADLNEHSMQITKKRKLRKLGSSMRRILVNQVIPF